MAWREDAKITKLSSDLLTAQRVKVGASAIELPTALTISAAAGSTNIANVTLTVKNSAGTTLAAVWPLTIWLSDAATGVGLTATSASGTVQAKSASGTDLGVLTAKKALQVNTLATGIYILEITDSAKTGFYVAAQLPNGITVISSKLVTANYG